MAHNTHLQHRFSWALPVGQDVEGFDGQVYDIQVSQLTVYQAKVV
jgi:hypothetical protein